MLAASGASLDVECVDIGGATFSRTVAFECTIPIGAISTLGRHKSCRHLCGFLRPRIELGDELARVEEEARERESPGFDQDEIARRLSMHRLGVRPR